jgi:molybdopterin synthase sulfur carrier subunit
MIRLVFLGKLADLAGKTDEQIAATSRLCWSDVVGWLEGHYSKALVAEALGRKTRVAVNGALVADPQTLDFDAGDEIAFLPPVSGG